MTYDKESRQRNRTATEGRGGGFFARHESLASLLYIGLLSALFVYMVYCAWWQHAWGQAAATLLLWVCWFFIAPMVILPNITQRIKEKE